MKLKKDQTITLTASQREAFHSITYAMNEWYKKCAFKDSVSSRDTTPLEFGVFSQGPVNIGEWLYFVLPNGMRAWSCTRDVASANDTHRCWASTIWLWEAGVDGTPWGVSSKCAHIWEGYPDAPITF
jgi:hypothetical protein